MSDDCCTDRDGDDEEMTTFIMKLKRNGVEESVLRDLQGMLRRCSLCTVGALRLFSDHLSELAESLFDTSTPMGKLQAQGLVASIRDAACIPAIGYGVPLEGSTRSRKEGKSSNRSSTSCFSADTSNSARSTSGSSSQMLPGVQAIPPMSVHLPAHIREEALRLRKLAANDNPVTEPTARPMVISTVIWLQRMGVVCKTDHPHVIERVGELLHAEELLPLKYLAVPRGAARATTFAERINHFLINKPRRRDGDGKRLFIIEAAHDEELTTPTRALQTEGYLVVCEAGKQPTQGHSGKSIIGLGRKVPAARPPSPVLVRDTSEKDAEPSPAPAASVASTASVQPEQGHPQPQRNKDCSSAQSVGFVQNQLNAAAMLSSLAQSAGLDISVSYPGRSSGSVRVNPNSNSLATNAATTAAGAQSVGERDEQHTARATAAPAKRTRSPAGLRDADSSDDDDAGRRDDRNPRANASRADGGKQKQQTRAPLKMRQVAKEDPLLRQESVGPPLTEANAVGRWVLVPGCEFGEEQVGGWTGKIVKVDRRKDKLTTIQMQDGKQHWKLAYVQSKFKILV